MMPEDIDDLLVRYLGLLDEYTSLRASLATRQVAMYSQLARANFAAERGFRYGPDHFDGRMQATARVEISAGAKRDSNKGDAASFTICRPAKPTTADTREKDDSEKKQHAREDGGTDGESMSKTNDKPVKGKPGKTDGEAAKEARPPRDPLQWFGVLTPMALRLAQQEAVETVDKIVPRLASVDAEMAALEIEVRRARKKRARAEAACEKDRREHQTTTSSIAKPLDGATLGPAA